MHIRSSLVPHSRAALAALIAVALGAGCRATLGDDDRAPLDDAGSFRPDVPVPVAQPDSGPQDSGPQDGGLADSSQWDGCDGDACTKPGPAPFAGCHRRRPQVAGDLNGDGRADIVLISGVVSLVTKIPWYTVPIGLWSPTGIPMTNIVNDSNQTFASYAAQNPVPLLGDVDGDGRADVLLAGGYRDGNRATPWDCVPVGLSNGDGTFTVSTTYLGGFAARAVDATSTKLAGDFNGDGRADVALVGGTSSMDVAVAFAGASGLFTTVVEPAPALAARASVVGAHVVAGDFDGDGKSDIAIVTSTPSPSISVGYSNGDATFRLVEAVAPGLAGQANLARSLIVAGDFDADGKDDLAIAGDGVTSKLVIAFARPNNRFQVMPSSGSELAGYAANPSSTLVAGDFDGDGCTDLAVAGATLADGGPNTKLPIGYSNGDGTFRLTETPAVDLQIFTGQLAKVLSASEAHH